MSFMARATVSPALYRGTLTTGTYIAGSDRYIGKYAPGSVGSVSPSALTTGNTITSCYDFNSKSAVLVLAGFSSDPGKGFVNSVTTGPQSTTLSGASATYSYSSGTATWTWNTAYFFLVTGTTYDLIING